MNDWCSSLLRSSNKVDHEGSHTKAACRFRAATMLPLFFFSGGGTGQGVVVPFSALVSRRIRMEKGERIRAEALVA